MANNKSEDGPAQLSLDVDDAVNHPKHYNAHPSGIECIDVIEHMGFNLGNVIKYTWRCDEKRDAIEDLEKAAWYLKREIANRKKAKERQEQNGQN